MSDKMREAFNALIAQGHMVGFDDFRTGWESHEALADHSGDANEMVPAVKDSLTADSQQPAAVVELTDSELEAGRHQVFSTNNPFCPCDSKTFRKAARWAIAAHITKQGGA